MKVEVAVLLLSLISLRRVSVDVKQHSSQQSGLMVSVDGGLLTTMKLVTSLILSRLDYCNSLLHLAFLCP